jgi:integrase
MERKEMKALTASEVTKFLGAAKDDDHGTFFAFAVATGMRPKEYLALKWSDVNYDLRHTCASILLGANEHPKIVRSAWATRPLHSPRCLLSRNTIDATGRTR